MESVSKLSTESVGSRRELVSNAVSTADADATQLDSWVESRRRCVLGITVHVSAVAADWHGVMVSQRITQPSIARDKGQSEPRCS